MKRTLVVVALGVMGLTGCATAVDDPVTQFAEPGAPRQATTEQTLSGPLPQQVDVRIVETPYHGDRPALGIPQVFPEVPARQQPNLGPHLETP